MTVADVAKQLQLSWDVVKEIEKKYLQKKYRKPNYKNLRFLAVYEISIAKHHKYLTIVLNLETGHIVYIGRDRKQESLDAFFQQVGKIRCRRIEAIAMDCWDPYIASVAQYLGHHKMVFDKFHLVSNYGKAMDKARISEFNKADLEHREVIKGTKYLLLANEENLKKQQQREKLKAVLELNENINLSHILKDQLKLIWVYDQPEQIEQALNNWIAQATASGLTPLSKFANMLTRYHYGILYYCCYPISTGKLEGTNNKIKVLKRKAYGFRDMEYFKLKLLDLHGTNSKTG